MAFSKITLNGTTLIDVTQKTVAANSMLNGITALDAAGQDITGTIVNRSSSDLTVSGTTVNVPVGNYPQGASIDMSSSIVDLIYPVGSLYMSASSTSPATLFPGTTWTQIQDTFLLAAGNTYTAGATGGEAEHTLTKPELPQIYGRVNYHGQTADGRGGTFTSSATGDFKPVAQQTVYKLYTTTNSGATSIGGHELDVGENQPHNNMPPYLAVYVWQRTV